MLEDLVERIYEDGRVVKVVLDMNLFLDYVEDSYFIILFFVSMFLN